MSEEAKKDEGSSLCRGPARTVWLVIAVALILPLEIQGWMAISDHFGRCRAAAVHRGMAEQSFKKSNHQNALAGFVRAEALAPSASAEISVVRARLFVAALQPELIDARSTTDLEYDIAVGFEKDPGNELYYRTVQGHLAALRNNLDAATVVYREVLAKDKNNPAANYGLALILQRTSPREAEEAFTKVVEVLPTHYEGLIGLASAKLSTGNFDGALTTLHDALGFRDDLRIHRLAGQAHIRKNQPPEAIVEFETAVRMNAQDFDSLVGLGSAYAATNDLQKAERALRAAAQIRGDENTLTNLTTVLMRQQKFSEAVQIINPAIQNRTAGPTLVLNAARGWEGLGNLKNARLLYQEAQKMLQSGGLELDKAMAETIIREASLGIQRIDQQAPKDEEATPK